MKDKEKIEAFDLLTERIDSMKSTMNSFLAQIEAEIKDNPEDTALKGMQAGYKISMQQFKNRFHNFLNKKA